jgi:hypothetical protein
MREICREERSLRAAMKINSLMALVIVGCLGFLATGCAEEQESMEPPPPAPPEYADRHMPAGWWADEKIIGKPVKAGARDFRKGERMKLYSDSVWFWRISEGVPNTKMKAWKSKLPEEDRWKAMAYERTFGLKGMGYDVARKEWVLLAELGKPAPAAAPAAGDGKAPAATPAKDGAKKGGK